MNVPLRVVPLVLGLFVLLLQGCALPPKNIKLDPPVEVAPSSVGQGKIVWVQVRDVRVRKTLGNVGDPDGKFTQVSVDDDFSTSVYQRVSAAMRKIGFAPQPTPGPDGRQLVIEVTELKYQSLKQTLTFATEASVSLTAKATSGNQHYDRVYNAGEQKTGALMPDERERAETVNKIVGMALEDMLNDSRLVAVLTQ